MEQAHDLGSDIFEPGDMVTPDAEDMVLDLAALDMGSEPDLPDSPPDLSEDPGSPIEQAQPFAEGIPAWGDRAIDIGAGKEVLVESLQGDVHRWETGPQGGYHLWVGSSFDATLIEALSDEELATFTILYRVWRQDGTLLASTQRLGGLTRDEGLALVNTPCSKRPSARAVWMVSCCSFESTSLYPMKVRRVIALFGSPASAVTDLLEVVLPRALYIYIQDKALQRKRS